MQKRWLLKSLLILCVPVLLAPDGPIPFSEERFTELNEMGMARLMGEGSQLEIYVSQTDPATATLLTSEGSEIMHLSVEREAIAAALRKIRSGSQVVGARETAYGIAELKAAAEEMNVRIESDPNRLEQMTLEELAQLQKDLELLARRAGQREVAARFGGKKKFTDIRTSAERASRQLTTLIDRANTYSLQVAVTEFEFNILKGLDVERRIKRLQNMCNNWQMRIITGFTPGP